MQINNEDINLSLKHLLESVQAKIDKDGDRAKLTDEEKLACCIKAGCEIQFKEPVCSPVNYKYFQTWVTTYPVAVVIIDREIKVYENTQV